VPLTVPVVPVAAALLPGRKVLLWSAYRPDTFHVGASMTQTAVLDLATGTVSARTVTETGHDMFCPGTALLPDGRLLVNGGDTNDRTSVYDPATATWTADAPLVIPRGYQSAVTLSDGRVFTLGGSWSEGKEAAGDKDGEVWSPTAGSTLLPDAPVGPILTNDPDGRYRADNHPWLFAWTGGTVFHAGPSRAMGWYGTTGSGSYTPAGVRGTDADAMNGSAAMYDVGKILTVGGAPAYEDSVATDHANLIDLTSRRSGGQVAVTPLSPMVHPRAFATSVVLPDGKVVVVGGQGYSKPYSDATAVMTPELWDPATRTFTEMAPMAIPRTYHSIALLLPDGRVLVGGGGLCNGCGTDHLDAEIFTPPYLLDPQGRPRIRPAITRAPSQAAPGSRIAVTTNRQVRSFALVRASSVTHSVDTDQRRVPLTVVRSTGNHYTLALPPDRGVLVPGSYLLFALDSRGVPSVATTVGVR
jgi:galactose oxidase